jgi:hypothetical protein
MKRFTSPILTMLALACLWAAGSQNHSLAERRTRNNPELQELENAPPLIVFTTVALGGFRGIIADMLWLRMAYLQDAGNYVEMVQLSDWITRLEPRCTEIWSFHAWNMAYNVSVMMPDPEDRWRWVSSGIRLLRDEGTRFNPTDPDLYGQLAWIFLHKIGRPSDEAQPFYLKRWAEEMHRLLGSAHPDFDALFQDPARARRMREEYRMDPDLIRDIQARHGKLDWFRPETQALYWATVGSRQARGAQSFLCQRVLEQSLRALTSGSPPPGQP